MHFICFNWLLKIGVIMFFKALCHQVSSEARCYSRQGPPKANFKKGS